MRCGPWAADCCGGEEGINGCPEHLADRLEPDTPDRGELVNRQDGSPRRATACHLGHHRPSSLSGTHHSRSQQHPPFIDGRHCRYGDRYYEQPQESTATGWGRARSRTHSGRRFP
jgi:hypothetical protein